MNTPDQRGSALVAAVGVLAAMTLLAMMSLMAAGSDLVLSTRLVRERSAFYAAESALATAVAELVADESLLPEASFHPPWPPPGIAVRHWQDGEWACARRVCLVPDVADADADPATAIVLFNRDFGHPASPLLRGGYPVLQVLVTAQGRESRQSIVAEIAPVTCAPNPAAAWVASGPLELSGEIRVVGSATLPALAGPFPVRLLAGAVVEGGPAADPQTPPGDVLRILNAGGTISRLDELPEPSRESSLKGLRWSRGDYSGPVDGEGILVVHNPAFDPAKHEASRVAIEQGVRGDAYDPSYSHLDPSRQPARLDVIAGGAFSGLIVADALGAAAAPFSLTGALVTLTRSPLSVAAAAPLRVVGSREALERAGRGALRHLVGFRPIAAAQAMPERCP